MGRIFGTKITGWDGCDRSLRSRYYFVLLHDVIPYIYYGPFGGAQPPNTKMYGAVRGSTAPQYKNARRHTILYDAGRGGELPASVARPKAFLSAHTHTVDERMRRRRAHTQEGCLKRFVQPTLMRRREYRNTGRRKLR